MTFPSFAISPLGRPRLHAMAPVLATALLAACGGSDSPPAATAPQMRLSITATEDVAGTYGSVGAYEKLTGTLRGEVDPADPRNAVIQDLQLAPSTRAAWWSTAPTS